MSRRRARETPPRARKGKAEAAPRPRTADAESPSPTDITWKLARKPATKAAEQAKGSKRAAVKLPPEPPSAAPAWRAAAIALIAVGVGLVIVGLTGESQPEPPPRAAPTPTDNGTAQLHARLDDLAAAWQPHVRARILAAAPDHADTLGPPLIAMLEHGQLPPKRQCAIEYAGAMRHADLRPPLAALTADLEHPLRGRAALAANEIEAWPTEQLVLWLDGDDEQLLVAALQLSDGRDDAPYDRAAQLIGHESTEVRDAALTLLVQAESESAQRSLWQMITEGSEASVAALQAIAEGGHVDTFEDSLLEYLPRLHMDAQRAALACLTVKRSPLADPTPVWQLATDVNQEPMVRAHAFHCLERTKSADANAIRDQLFFLDPLLLHFAARCLVAQADPKGTDVLADLADNENSDVRTASRQLLAWLTGLGAAASSEDLRRAGADTRVGNRPLPEPKLLQ